VPKTALVVDDSVSMRRLVAQTLRQAGFSVVESENGADALGRIEGERIDVVITDLNMPVMDGITFITRLRAQARHRFTPVLMLTTDNHDAKKQAGRAAGATGWILKPFNPQQLLQVIARVVP